MYKFYLFMCVCIHTHTYLYMCIYIYVISHGSLQTNCGRIRGALLARHLYMFVCKDANKLTSQHQKLEDMP